LLISNSERALSWVVPGSIAKKSLRIEDDAMRLGIVNYYNQNGPKVHLTRARPGGNTEMLGSFADTYSYALLDGRRVMLITESRRGAGSSLIQIHFKNELYAGEIRHIFRHKQTGVSQSKETMLAFVAWMIPSTETPLDADNFMWNDL
jgi:hypothetical protein